MWRSNILTQGRKKMQVLCSTPAYRMFGHMLCGFRTAFLLWVLLTSDTARMLLSWEIHSARLLSRLWSIHLQRRLWGVPGLILGVSSTGCRRRRSTDRLRSGTWSLYRPQMIPLWITSIIREFHLPPTWQRTHTASVLRPPWRQH